MNHPSKILVAFIMLLALMPLSAAQVSEISSVVAGVAGDAMPGLDPAEECIMPDGIEDDIMAALLETNQSFLGYDFRQIVDLYCSKWDESVNFYGSLELKNAESDVRYYSAYFNGYMKDELTLDYVSDPYPVYNTTSYFTEEEESKLGYQLRTKIIDFEVYGEGGGPVWISVNPSMPIRCFAAGCESQDAMKCDDFKSKFDALLSESQAEDSYYYRKDYTSPGYSYENCYGLLKIGIASVRSVARGWEGYIDYFGKDIEYYYYANANVQLNLDDVISGATASGCTLYDPSNIDDVVAYKISGIPSGDMEPSCTVYYQGSMLGFYAYRELGPGAWVSVSIYGNIGKEGDFQASVSGENALQYKDAGIAFIKEAIQSIGLDLDVILEEYDEGPYYTTSEIQGVGEVTTSINSVESGCMQSEGSCCINDACSSAECSCKEGYFSTIACTEDCAAECSCVPSKTATELPKKEPSSTPEKRYTVLRAQMKVAIPDSDYASMLAGWERTEYQFTVQYQKEGMGVSISQPTVSISRYDDNYDWISVSPTGIYTSVNIPERDEVAARAALSSLVSPYASVASDSWTIIETYPVSTDRTPWLYAYGIRGAALESSDKILSEGGSPSLMPSGVAGSIPSFDDAFNQLMSNVQGGTDEDGQPIRMPDRDIIPGWILYTLIGVSVVIAVAAVFFLAR